MTIPPIVFGIVVILHFVGLASLLGGVMVQIKETIAGKGRIMAAMFHGALLQLITGLLLVGFVEMGGDGSLNYAKITTKLVILIVITVLVLMYRKKATVASWVVWAIGALTLANIVIAVLWK